MLESEFHGTESVGAAAMDSALPDYLQLSFGTTDERGSNRSFLSRRALLAGAGRE